MVPHDLGGREAITDAVQEHLGNAGLASGAAHVLVKQAFEDEAAAAGLAVEPFELEHRVATGEGGHQVGEDGVCDGAGVCDDSLLAEVGGVWWDVDVVRAVGLFPVVVALADARVGHVDHGLNVVRDAALLLVG